MKNLLGSSFPVLAILSLMVTDTASISSTIVGDILIQSENGTIYCDKLICPPGSTACHVTKRNDPNNFSKIIRTRKCYGPDGAVLHEDTEIERNRYGENVNIHVSSGGGGNYISRKLTPEEEKELEETLRRTQERVQAEVQQTLNGLDEYLRPFRDGSFSENLRNSINNQVRNSLGAVFNDWRK